MGRTRLFVYGTLRRGEIGHGLLEGATFEKTCRTAPCFTLVDLGEYPGLVRAGGTAVTGEAYWISEDALQRLDTYEDHPELYERAEIVLEDERSALAYLLPPSRATGLPTIASGDWVKR